MKSRATKGNTFGFEGLNDSGVVASRATHGTNAITKKRTGGSLDIVLGIVKEPMVLLLVAACAIYFITGQTAEAFFMLFAIGFTISISIFQDQRSRKAIKALQSLTAPECKVIRNREVVKIATSDVVVGDFLLAEEGATIAADAVVVHANDFSVNEAMLTGESLPVIKSNATSNNQIYQGTTVTRGMAIGQVVAVGESTALARIGKSLEDIGREETPLEQQINSFVRRMAYIGIVFFVAVWAINFIRTVDVLDSLLKSLALAMSILPEEIPVAFTVFMALGAWRLARIGIIVKKTSTVETLGSATIICADKTGTITENQMQLKSVYAFADNKLIDVPERTASTDHVIRTAMWASEPLPFDNMEVSLHQAYEGSAGIDERPQNHMVREYPLEGHPPFMTHVLEDGSGNRIIAAKGAPEGIMQVCRLDTAELEKVNAVIDRLTAGGARVLGVAEGIQPEGEFPADQRLFSFRFTGLVAFYDPPKKNISEVIRSFHRAGIRVKMITGDHPHTATAIARQIGLPESQHVLTGGQLATMDTDELRKKAETTGVFARMLPDDKLKVLNALKENGHIVAMTGDGVNDGPALKAAHIGIAMGRRGTEIAREVSPLVLSDDDLGKMIDAVAAGRKIYANLKKGIQYIISIHIPIILTVFIPLVFGWSHPFIFTPVIVIFLEMVMGPTCSIVYENEPLERSLMSDKPRPITKTFFNVRELLVSIVQGLMIAAGVLFVYHHALTESLGETVTRSMTFVTLISANVVLTLINRSMIHPLWISLRYKNRLVPLVISVTIGLTASILYIQPVASFFKVVPPGGGQLLMSIGVGVLSVIWFEIIKVVYLRRRRHAS